MVILEHDHTAQIVSMRIHAADHHAVLLHEPESGRGLARAGDGAFPALCSGEVAEAARATAVSENRRSAEPQRRRTGESAEATMRIDVGGAEVT